MKNTKTLLVSLALVICMVLSLASCVVEAPENNDVTPTYSYIAIDINPSIEIVTDENDIVVTVNACNDDAKVLLNGEEIEGISLEEATEKIVTLAEELGYLNDENTDINFTVSCDKDEIKAKLESKLKTAAEKAYKSAEVVFEASEELKEKANELKERLPELEGKINEAKVRLIEAIQELDSEFTTEEGLELEVHQLARKLAELKRQNDENTPEDVKNAMHEHFKKIKEEARRNIAGVYGDEFFSKWENHEELKESFDEIKEQYEEITISSEDTTKIEELLEIDLGEIKNENGEASLADLKDFLKGKLEAYAKETVDELMETLRTYEAAIFEHDAFKEMHDKFIKPEADKNMEDKEIPEIESFEDIEEFVKGEGERIKEFKGQIELDEEKREQIKGYKDHMKGSLDDIEKELEDLKNQLDELFPSANKDEN